MSDAENQYSHFRSNCIHIVESYKRCEKDRVENHSLHFIQSVGKIILHIL